VTDVHEEILRGKRYLILDRDAKYTEGFRGAVFDQPPCLDMTLVHPDDIELRPPP